MFVFPTYTHLENFITDLVPSEMARLASSLGRIRWTDVCISCHEIVGFTEYAVSLDASVAMHLKMSFRKNEDGHCLVRDTDQWVHLQHLVNVSLLSCILTLLLLPICRHPQEFRYQFGAF
jgi:hypothetical protein